MADQEITLEWRKARDHKIFESTTQLIQLEDHGGGMHLVIHFTSNGSEVVSEKFLAETVQPQGLRQKGPSTHEVVNFKVEEAVAKMSLDAAGAFVVALMGLFSFLPPHRQQEIRDAISKIPTP